MTHLAPPKHGWAIWIGHYERKNWVGEWISTPFHSSKGDFGKKASYFNSNASTQVIGNLFIHVIHSPARRFVDRWRFNLPEGGPLVKIWPVQSHSIKWTLGAMTDIDAEFASTAVHNYLITLLHSRNAISRSLQR